MIDHAIKEVIIKRWSAASLTFDNYFFYLFLCLCTMRITIITFPRVHTCRIKETENDVSSLMQCLI